MMRSMVAPSPTVMHRSRGWGVVASYENYHAYSFPCALGHVLPWFGHGAKFSQTVSRCTGACPLTCAVMMRDISRGVWLTTTTWEAPSDVACLVMSPRSTEHTAAGPPRQAHHGNGVDGGEERGENRENVDKAVTTSAPSGLAAVGERTAISAAKNTVSQRERFRPGRCPRTSEPRLTSKWLSLSPPTPTRRGGCFVLGTSPRHAARTLGPRASREESANP